MADPGLRIGLDLGGTKIYGVLVRGTEVVAHTKHPTPSGGVDDVIDELVATVEELQGSETVEAIGIGTPGIVEPSTGTLQVAPNIAGFDKPVPLGERLRSRLDVPVTVANDVNAAAYGEAKAGAAQGYRDVLAVWMGTGLGGGLILDGRLRSGRLGLAAEIGHTIVVPGGRRCGCGGEGHLEAYVGRRMLEASIREQAASGRVSSILEGDPDKLKSKAFRQAYDRGDEVVVELLDHAIDLLAVAVGNVALTVELEAVVLGGGLGDRFEDIVIPRLTGSLEVLLFAGVPPVVVGAALEDESGAIGAALLATTT